MIIFSKTGEMAGGYLGGAAAGLGPGLPPLPTEILMDEYMFGRRRQVSYLHKQILIQSCESEVNH